MDRPGERRLSVTGVDPLQHMPAWPRERNVAPTDEAYSTTPPRGAGGG